MAGIIGSQLGRTYQRAEGTGEAFILPDQNIAAMTALEGMRRMEARFDAEQKERKKKKEAEEAAGLAQLAALPKTDFFHRHNQVKQEKLNNLRNWAIDLMGAGVTNPFTNPKAAEFQKAVADFQSLAGYSKGLETEYKKIQTLVNTDSEKYDARSVQDVMGFYENNELEELYQGNAAPPRLYRKDADFELAKKVSELSTMMNSSGDKTKKSTDDLISTSKMAFSSDDATQWQNNTDRYLQRLTASERKQINDLATIKGMTSNEYVLYSWLTPLYNVEEFDMDKFVQNIEVSTAENAIERGNVTEKTLKANREKVEEQVRLMLKLHPNALKHGLENGMWQNHDDAVKILTDLKISGVSTKFSRLLDEPTTKSYNDGTIRFGSWRGDPRTLETNFNQWASDFRNRVGEAGGFAKGTKTAAGDIIGGVEFMTSEEMSEVTLTGPVKGKTSDRLIITKGVQPKVDHFGDEIPGQFEEQVIETELDLESITDEELRKIYIQGVKNSGHLYGDERTDITVPTTGGGATGGGLYFGVD